MSRWRSSTLRSSRKRMSETKTILWSQKSKQPADGTKQRLHTKRRQRREPQAQPPPRTHRPDAVIVTARGKTYNEILAMVSRRDDNQLSGLGSCVSKVLGPTKHQYRLLELFYLMSPHTACMSHID